MLVAKQDKDIVMIGVEQSTLTQEMYYGVLAETTIPTRIITPTEFIELDNKHLYQYAIAFSLEIELRKEVIKIIKDLDLDCITYAHDSIYLYDDLDKIAGKGTFIAPFSTVLLGSKIGEHCIIEAYCLVSHYAELKDNVILHAGSMIAGKTTIGENSMFNFRASALPGLTIGSDIEVGAASTATKNLQEPGVYIGTPARRFRDRTDFKDNNDV
jgi:acetyltransferase-like isoleucine patch superfamily enzyme